jgi:hypothetical protein
MQDEFSKWYNKKFGEISRDPGEDVWANISASLDQPQGADQKRRRWRLPVYALSVLLITISLFFIFSGNKKSNNIAQHSSPKTQTVIIEQKQIVSNKTENQTAESSSPDLSNALSATYENQNQPVESETSIHKNEKTIPTAIKENSNKTVYFSNKKSTPIVQIQNEQKEIPLTENQEKTDSIPESTLVELPTSPPTIVPIANEAPPLNQTLAVAPPVIGVNDSVFHNIPPSRGFYYGIVGRLNNSWLLNNETYTGLEASGLNQTHFFFGPSYGIQAGFYNSPRVIFESQLLVHNQLGQTYTLFNEGIKQEKQILITSSSLSVVAKIKLKKSTGTLDGFYFIVGPQFQFITKTTISVDRGFPPTDQFRKFTPGISSGIEYIIPSQNQWQLTTGFRTDIGCRNIYAGNGTEPSNFKKTLLCDAGIYICINRKAFRK